MTEHLIVELLGFCAHAPELKEIGSGDAVVVIVVNTHPERIVFSLLFKSSRLRNLSL